MLVDYPCMKYDILEFRIIITLLSVAKCILSNIYFLKNCISSVYYPLSFLSVKAKLRSSSWWVRYFAQNSLEENVAAARKFEKAATKSSYNPNCQIFHLKSFH